MNAGTAALVSWCLDEGFFCLEPGKLVTGFVAHAVRAGIPIERLAVTLRTLHPQLSAVGWVWESGSPFVERQYRAVSTRLEDFKKSPVKPLLEGTESVIRVRLQGADIERYPITQQLHTRGHTDYVAVAVMAGDRRPNVVTLSTKAPGGFSPENLETLRGAMSAFGALLDRAALRLIARNICTTYIGPNTGPRVLDGAIHRGAIERVRAAIWFSDLRGFTARTQKLGTEGTVALLNQWFGVVGDAVQAEGGEILKFIGDAALVVFAVEDGDDGTACTRALAGAARTRAGVATLDTPDGLPIDFGVGLHLGEVAYGNIGSAQRLDFTVIGHTVNIASRLEGLCSQLGRSVLASRAFAEALPGAMAPVGRFDLKGVDGAEDVFAPL